MRTRHHVASVENTVTMVCWQKNRIKTFKEKKNLLFITLPLSRILLPRCVSTVCASWTPACSWIGLKLISVCVCERVQVCWQRVRIMDNRLFVDQPEVDKYPRRPGEEEDKWYILHTN